MFHLVNDPKSYNHLLVSDQPVEYSGKMKDLWKVEDDSRQHDRNQIPAQNTTTTLSEKWNGIWKILISLKVTITVWVSFDILWDK